MTWKDVLVGVAALLFGSFIGCGIMLSYINAKTLSTYKQSTDIFERGSVNDTLTGKSVRSITYVITNRTFYDEGKK